MEPQHVLDKPGQTFPVGMRLAVFDALINQVPTKNIPHLIGKFAGRFGVSIASIPHRSTVEAMARELGVIADVQTAKALLNNEHVTLGFDATTQEGVHINAIHITTESACYVVAVDELPGGTAVDYSEHICQSIDHLSATYSKFTHTDLQTNHRNIINNMSNCMMDRVAANHAAIVLVNEAWHKTLNELNCHLHPLDTIASSSRSALRKLESEKGKLFGNDCFAANIVLQMNKMRYKDGNEGPTWLQVVSPFWEVAAWVHTQVSRKPAARAVSYMRQISREARRHVAISAMRNYRMWRAADGSDSGLRHRDRQTRAASSRTVRQATERSVDAQILHVRRVGHQSHSTDRHHQGCHHVHARGNGRSYTAACVNPWFFRRRSWPRYWHHSQRTSEASSWCRVLFTYDADCDLRDDNGVGAAIQSLLLSGRHREIDKWDTLGHISQHGRRRGYGDVLGSTKKVSTRYHMLPVFKNESALIQFAIIRGRKLHQLRRMKQWDIQAELSATKLQERDKRPQESGKTVEDHEHGRSVRNNIYHIEPTK